MFAMLLKSLNLHTSSKIVKISDFGPFLGGWLGACVLAYFGKSPKIWSSPYIRFDPKNSVFHTFLRGAFYPPKPLKTAILSVFEPSGATRENFITTCCCMLTHLEAYKFYNFVTCLLWLLYADAFLHADYVFELRRLALSGGRAPVGLLNH